MKKLLFASMLAGTVGMLFAAEPILKLDGESIPDGTAGVTSVDGGIAGKCFQADGTGSLAVAKDLALEGPFSFALWVKPDPAISGGYAGLIDYQNNILRLQSRTTVDMNLNGWHTAVAKRVLTLGEWSHVGVVYDGQKLIVYVDGKEAASVDKPDQRIRNREGVTFFCTEGKHFFQGQADEVMIFNVALTPEEMAALAKRAE